MSGGSGSDDASRKWDEAWHVVCQTPDLFEAYKQAPPGDEDGARTALVMGIIAENDRQRQSGVQAQAVPLTDFESDVQEWNACLAIANARKSIGEQSAVSPELTQKLLVVAREAVSAGIDFASIADLKDVKDKDTQTVEIKEEKTVEKEKTVKKTRQPRKRLATPSASSSSSSGSDVSDYDSPPKKTRGRATGRKLRARASTVQGMYTDPPDFEDEDLIRLEKGEAEERKLRVKRQARFLVSMDAEPERPVRANRQGVERFSPGL